jgi:hypothetical protein
MAKPVDTKRAAERAMNDCCEGDPWPTARNLASFSAHLLGIAVYRCAMRVQAQPLSLLRWRRNVKYGGRA